MSENLRNLPTEPPVVGGWYWNEERQLVMFLMPPYPGVDDCVRVGNSWGYRSLVDRDNARSQIWRDLEVKK